MEPEPNDAEDPRSETDQPAPKLPSGWKLLEPPKYLPANWRVLESNKGRIVYESPPPRTKIQTRNQLVQHQKAGRFCELDAQKISFLKKLKPRKKGYVNLPEGGETLGEVHLESVAAESFETALDLDELETSSSLSVSEPVSGAFELESTISVSDAHVRHKIINHDLEKVLESVHLLTIDPNIKINHTDELVSAAKLMNEARGNFEVDETNFAKLKNDILMSENLESCLQTFWKCNEARNFFNQMGNAECLEELIHIGRSYVSSPLQTFPPNINQNLYSEIIKFGLSHSRNTILFLMNIVTKKDQSVTPDDVIKIAFLLSSFASSVNRENNSLLKIKSTLLQRCGLSNEGLDSCQALGVTESSRSQRRIKDFFAGISQEVLKASAKLYPHVSTMDNLDFKAANQLHHMTLEYIEIEKDDTKQLDKKSLEFDEIVDLFHLETILLKKEKNVVLLKHFEKVTAITIGRILAKRVPAASFLTHLLDNHYDHPDFKCDPQPSILFTKKPLYLQETKNEDMIKICMSVQLDFLTLSAELASDKEAFLIDFEMIQSQDCEASIREAAEQRIHAEVIQSGEFIGYGDLLTFLKFYDAKRLMQSGVTALERLEFISYFKVALFHGKMNKTFQGKL